MVVITTPSLPAEAAGEAQLAQYASRLFQKTGLNRSEISDGLLVFMAREYQDAVVLVTPSWSSELCEQINWTFQNETLKAVSEGDPSRGIAQLVERFDQIVRMRMLAK